MSLTRFINQINEWCGKIFSWVIVVIMMLVVFEVVTRRFFDSPTIWTFDVITHLSGFYFIMLVGYTLLYNGHVGVDVFYSRFSEKTKALFDIISYTIFFFPWIGVMIWQGYILANTSWQRKECAFGLFAIPIYPLKISLFVGIVLLCLQGISTYLSAIKRFKEN